MHLFFATRAAVRQPEGGRALPPAAVAERLRAACLAESRELEAEGVTRARVHDALARFGMSAGQLIEPGSLTGPARSTDTPVPAASATPDAGALRALADRVVYTLINDGARMVDAGQVARASDLDVISVNACGFPAWRGGAMLYADEVGLARVRDTLRELQHRYGERWAPAPLLERLATSGGTFREYDRSRVKDV
jgi:3-hydroxyacyl-CoA dehydrogenase